MVQNKMALHEKSVIVFGITYKEDTADLRDSRVPEIIAELRSFGIQVFVHDPLVTSKQVMREYGIELTPWEELPKAGAAIVAVSHEQYFQDPQRLLEKIETNGCLIDVKHAIKLKPGEREDITLWSL